MHSAFCLPVTHCFDTVLKYQNNVADKAFEYKKKTFS